MDALFAEVSGIVAEGECEKLDPAETFTRVKHAAEVAAGRPMSMMVSSEQRPAVAAQAHGVMVLLR